MVICLVYVSHLDTKSNEFVEGKLSVSSCVFGCQKYFIYMYNFSSAESVLVWAGSYRLGDYI